VGLITLTIPVLIIALVITALLCYWRKITPLQGALAGFLVFIALSYRVNYQYLIVFIPLAILLASRTQYKIERIFALALAILPAAWVWLANIPWWFHNLKPDYYWPHSHFGSFRFIRTLLAGLGLRNFCLCADVSLAGLCCTRVYEVATAQRG